MITTATTTPSTVKLNGQSDQAATASAGSPSTRIVPYTRPYRRRSGPGIPRSRGCTPRWFTMARAASPITTAHTRLRTALHRAAHVVERDEHAHADAHDGPGPPRRRHGRRVDVGKEAGGAAGGRPG